MGKMGKGQQKFYGGMWEYEGMVEDSRGDTIRENLQRLHEGEGFMTHREYEGWVEWVRQVYDIYAELRMTDVWWNKVERIQSGSAFHDYVIQKKPG